MICLIIVVNLEGLVKNCCCLVEFGEKICLFEGDFFGILLSLVVGFGCFLILDGFVLVFFVIIW